MNYIDKYGQMHVKPVGEDGKPPTNDGMIVTAYAKKAGLPVELFNVAAFFIALLPSMFSGLPPQRLPGKPLPPPSRDFFLGAGGMPTLIERLKNQDWNFSPRPLPPFKLFKLLRQLWQMRGQDRNYFWKNNLDQVYRFAFSIPLTDRAFYYRAQGEKAPLLYRLIEWIDRKLKASNNSSKLIRWLKYDQVPEIKVFEEYFGKEHPIFLAVQAQRERETVAMREKVK